MNNGHFYLSTLDRSISERRVISLVFIFIIFLDIHVSTVNSVYPDQPPRSAASDFGLHCLPMCLLLDARHRVISE